MRGNPPRGRFALSLLVAAAALVVGLPQTSAGTGAAPQDVGEWGPVLNWPTQGKHMILMPTGKVLIFPVGDKSHVWNPATNEFKHVPATFGDIHCAGHVTLADGDPLVVGGVNVSPFVGIKVNARFDATTETWTVLKPMNYARWYPTVTALSDGRVLAISGTDENKSKATIPEVYDPQTDTWTELPGASRTQPLYPFMYEDPDDGRIIDAAPKGANQYLDVNGTGSWSSGPVRPWDNQSGGCCNESGALYGIGKILQSGGGDPAHARTGILDLTAVTPAWKEVEPMAFPRRRHNDVVLADGSVLAVGGTKAGDDVTQAVLEAERWDPATEQWDTMAAMSVPRMYHSAAILLPDGTVVAAGGDNPSSSAKLTAQIYKPPYLFKGPRPVITSSPASASYGGTFTVGTDTAGITKVALIRAGAATHAIDFNQRYVPLTFTESGSTLTVNAPASGRVAPPGAYMLVVANANGVPSVASWITFGAGPPPPTTPPTADFVGSPTNGNVPLTVSFANTATGTGPLTFQWDFQNDGTVDSTSPTPQFTYSSAGMYTVKLVVTNSVGSDDEIKTNYITVNEPPPPLPMPPTADFSGSPTNGTAPLKVTFTNLSTGSTPMTFQWDFQNDGTFDSTAVSPEFTYPAAGTYAVRLLATNEFGTDEELKTGYITVSEAPPPPPGGTTSIFSPEADARVQEANPTTNYGTSYLRADGATDPDVESYLRFDVSGVSTVTSAKLRVYATSATANGPAVYAVTNNSWTESGINWSNRPARATTATADKAAISANSWAEWDVTPLVSGNGTYTFALATDTTDGLNLNSREASTATLRPELVVTSTAPSGPPTAQFDAAPTSGTAPLTVTFRDKSSGATSWAWDFQDDDSFESTERNPQYTYTQPGTYTVRLQVENAFGGDEEIKVGYINVAALPPPPPPGTSFAPVADAYVKSDANTNTGTSTRLRVDASPMANTYLKFDLSGLSGAPQAAKLRLFVVDDGPAAGSIYSVSNAWIESGTGGITWSNAPPITGVPLSTLGAAPLNAWVEFDITAAITGSGTYSFAIKGASSNSVYYTSREGTLANRPTLVITPVVLGTPLRHVGH